MNTADMRTMAELLCANDAPTIGPGDAARALNLAADKMDAMHAVLATLSAKADVGPEQLVDLLEVAEAEIKKQRSALAGGSLH